MIFVTGDIHGDFSRFSDKKLRKLKKGDSLIICGDFGLIWDGSKAERKLLKKLGKRKYNILFCEGAHENFDELEKYGTEEWNGGITRKISGNLRQLTRGQIFNVSGKKIFVFGGGRGEENGGKAPCDEDTRLRYEVPSLNELEAADELLKNNNNEVDYIISYNPPESISEFMGKTSGEADTISVYLEAKKSEVKFSRWFFGKHHTDKLIPTRFMACFNSLIDADTFKQA